MWAELLHGFSHFGLNVCYLHQLTSSNQSEPLLEWRKHMEGLGVGGKYSSTLATTLQAVPPFSSPFPHWLIWISHLFCRLLCGGKQGDGEKVKYTNWLCFPAWSIWLSDCRSGNTTSGCSKGVLWTPVLCIRYGEKSHHINAGPMSSQGVGCKCHTGPLWAKFPINGWHS